MWIAGALSAAALFGVLTACGGGGGGDDAADDGAADDGGGDDGGGDGGGGGGPILTRPSRSSTIALSDNKAWVAMVNPDAGTLSVFQTADNTRIGVVTTGGQPSSVVIAADNKTAFVANRADATVVRVRGIDTNAPAVDATVPVGSEPTGVALSPTGSTLYVAEMAEGRVSAISTSTMEIVASAPVDRPRALLVTNDLDDDATDELVVVTEFYGEPVPGKETKDDGRTGKVRLLGADLSDQGTISLSPTDSGFPNGGVEGNPNVRTSPNQLGSVAYLGGRIYITSVSASPAPPLHFDSNVFPVVYVADLSTKAEVTDGSGTTNLARKIVDAIPTPTPQAPRFIPGDLSDIDFVPGKNVAYTVGRAGDLMVRVVYSGGPVTVGSSQNVEVDLAGNDAIGKCQGPIGIAIVDETRAYINCWVTRRLGVIDLTSQSLASTVESAPLPQDAAGQSVQRGRRFYFTGRGRWSNGAGNGALGGEGWSSCGSCHPDGLTDNITWVFGAGPRQTTSQDGSFSHGSVLQKQRIFNWTGIFDEHHDFERNTRDVSGGLGAITTTISGSIDDCNKLDLEQQVPLTNADTTPIGGLAFPIKLLADDATVAICGHKDWDDIDNFVRSIRPARARTAIAPELVQQGRDLFVQGGCTGCHGGAGWTVSRRFFQPSEDGNATLATTDFIVPNFFAETLSYGPRTQISAQPPVPADNTGPAEPEAIPVAEAACVLRNVGTFGDRTNAAATDDLEKRPANGALVRAEGRAGYNVPSLYGLALGAPFLHHGQAASLEALFTDSRWDFHTNAGNANFGLTLGDGNNLEALVSFLWSIDADQEEFEARDVAGNDTDACPVQ
ncbi:MAG TPA: YncE family protein [Kofleriaceae bacterium]|nr:YncE family protein [Kofleriaceae bacterium]